MKGVWRIDSAASSSGAMNGGTRTRLRFEELGGPEFVQGEESLVRAVGRRVKKGGCKSAFLRRDGPGRRDHVKSHLVVLREEDDVSNRQD
jgi:hypothetical protein